MGYSQSYVHCVDVRRDHQSLTTLVWVLSTGHNEPGKSYRLYASSASLRAHKVRLQFPDADRAIMHEPNPCKSPSIPPTEGNTCIHAAWHVPDLWELGSVLLIKARMRGLSFLTGLKRCGEHHGLPEWAGLARGDYAASSVVYTDRG
jgi:hypothetical protein